MVAYKDCRGGPSGEAWPLGGRRTQRPATFKGLMVRSTKMKIGKIEALQKGKENPWPDEKCLIVFTFLCVSVGTHGKAWKNRHSYKSTKKQSFQNVRLLTAGAFVLDYSLKLGTQLSKIFPVVDDFANDMHVWPNQSFTESSLSNVFRPSSMSCSVDWHVRIEEPMRGAFKKSWAFVIIMQLPISNSCRAGLVTLLEFFQGVLFFCVSCPI